MSAGHYKRLNQLWGATLVRHHDRTSFKNTEDLHETIDSIPLGDVRWTSDTCNYKVTEKDGPGPLPSWKTATYEINFRDPCAVVCNLLANSDFKHEFDYTPIRDFTQTDGIRRRDFMSGDWAWKQADNIGKDKKTHGSMFVPVILGSDKTTVSVATGQNEYWPLYASIGNVHNNVRRAHRDVLVVIGFLALPKTSKEYANDDDFRKFR
ncbi:hypothetical protein CERSUDRAFT_60969, partial [Gelatoporia subvermispora B]